jgi:MoaA/NifB/PqqE/SkfB family radical SAM enzyme
VSLSDKVLWRTPEDDQSLPKDEYWLEVDEHNRLVLPREVREHFGIHPGAQILLKAGEKTLRLQRPITQIAKVYVEPTSRCNLSCRTCIRNAWDEAQGDMSMETWAGMLGSLKGLPQKPVVFFGGFGEPLAHPGILKMVEDAKPLARSVEMITNGMLLTEEVSRQLIKLNLDVLWISVDGATAEHLADVRLGAALQQIFQNIQRLALMRHETARIPEIGISFVAMKRNIADLPVLLHKGPSLGVSRFMITNVFPYTEEMIQEMLYTHTIDGQDSVPSPWAPIVDLPRIDLDDASQDAIVKAIRFRGNVTWNGVTLGQDRGRCPFIERGAVAVCWDGSVSPCLALMHRYKTYLHNKPRLVERHTIGNINQDELLTVWNRSENVEFRKRVAAFDFSPCIMCGGCSWSEANQEDCFANSFPTCGGCLWAQGVIQCP